MLINLKLITKHANFGLGVQYPRKVLIYIIWFVESTCINLQKSDLHAITK